MHQHLSAAYAHSFAHPCTRHIVGLSMPENAKVVMDVEMEPQMADRHEN